jgi:acyl-CoA synthetase (AMP-forming)/AMP-acid ligase II
MTAARLPEAVAIRERDRQLTYSGFHQWVGRLSSRLTASGVRLGDRVAVALPNSIESALAYYACMQAGAVAVPLNAQAKARDIEIWLRHSAPKVVFADQAHADFAAGYERSGVRAQVWYSTGEPDRPFGFDDGLTSSDAASELSSNAPACMIYTSGTTGRPKAVVLSHANLASNAAAIVDYLALREEDSVVSILPFYYSYGSSLLHTHILAGGCLILEKNLVYPHAVVETLARERATGFAGVPSTFALLLSRVKLADYDLSQLRYVTQAGGAMAPALTRRLRQALPGTELFVMYGQTEATARLTYLPPERLEDKLGSVGVPVSGVEIQIRDEAGQPAHADEVGEVWARGPNVMIGYWRDEAATAEVKKDGWLKTGDMGRLDADGFLYLVGRRSDMIKSGAHRIHPQDIEEAILELPSVQEAAVVGVDDEILGQSIKAFVVPAQDGTVTPMVIQAHCRERLASYKIPKAVEIVASLPKTASGKVKRAELKQ